MTDSGKAPAYVRTPVASFLNSLSVDRPLVRYDLAGSIAHAEMLGEVGLLTEDEVTSLVHGLREIAREVRAGTFPWRDELEDVHTNVEVRLTEKVGAVGGKLHTARSRNDQVALDERLYLRAAVGDVAHRLVRLQEALLARADETREVPMPGYTHLQRAQPVTVAHFLLAHYWRFDRDLDRLFATATRANVSPLGAGALAGSTLGVNPVTVAQTLGFDRSFENSIDAVSDRDPFAELLFDLALLAVHASGLAEEVVLFATKEFGFLERTSALGSGSSLMPQKRNPDAAELIRGKTGRTVGDLVNLLTTLKGLPLAYDRDLQEDKFPVLDSVATLTSVLDTLGDLVTGLTFNVARLRESASDPELLATDVAEQLVGQGIPFRQAHETVGAHLRAHAGHFSPSELRQLPGANEETARLLDPASAVARRSSPGGPAPVAVIHQLETARSRLGARRVSLSSLDQKVELIEELLNEEPP
ncbi:MAG TPA: argininosuccinate lyase [Thermoplasmata archaeon]|nr:argininosuccinate lyase [Thermoplasmata archaeon]